MSPFLKSHVFRALFAIPSRGRVLDAMAQRWRRLTGLLFDPYRPAGLIIMVSLITDEQICRLMRHICTKWKMQRSEI